MNDKLVPACLLLQEEELEQENDVSAFVESNFTDAGWQLCLVLVRGQKQTRGEFSPLLPPTLPTPRVNTRVEVQLLDGIDDAVAFMKWQGRLFEAQFSRSNLAGLIRFVLPEPFLRHLTRGEIGRGI